MRALGLPTSSAASAGLALGTRVRELRRLESPLVRGRIAVVACRNRTWIEWGLYTACWLQKLEHGPVVLYSGREMSYIYGQPLGRPTLRQRLYFAGLLA